MTRWTKRLLAGLSLLLPSAASGTLDLSPAPQKSQPLVFKADVALVAVPVYVTDDSGRSVRGLTAEDFEVEDDGKKVPIVAFRAVDVDTPLSAEAQAGLPRSIQDAVAEPRRFLLLLDLEFSPKTGVLRGRQAALAFVRDGLAPGDLISVAISGPAGLKATPFTSNHEAAAREIERVGIEGSVGSDPSGASDQMVPSGNARVDAEQASIDAEMMKGNIRLYHVRIGDFLDDLAALVKKLAPLPGRKQIVLLSGGFPETAWQDQPGGTSLIPSVNGDRMNRIFLDASRMDVVIHTIDLAGIAEGASVSNDSSLATLVALAHNTGGRSVRRTNDFRMALGEVDQVSRHSYVIAFQIADTNARKGQRKLKVRVRRPGLSVSHRATYALPPQDVASKTAAAPPSVVFRATERANGSLRLRLTSLPYLDATGKGSFHVLLHVDGAGLLEAARDNQIAIQIDGQVRQDGRNVDSMALKATIDLARFGDAVRGHGVAIAANFPVSPGRVDATFSVRTERPDLNGSVQRSFLAPEFIEGRTVLSVPVFTRPTSGRLVIPFQAQNRPKSEVPFRFGGESFVPESEATLSPGWARQLCVFVWPAGVSLTPPLEVIGEIVRAGAAPISLRVEGEPRVIPDPDGFDRYLIKIVAPEATPAGAYTLRLTFLDSVGRASTTSEADVLVK